MTRNSISPCNASRLVFCNLLTKAFFSTLADFVDWSHRKTGFVEYGSIFFGVFLSDEVYSEWN